MGGGEEYETLAVPSPPRDHASFPDLIGGLYEFHVAISWTFRYQTTTSE